MADIDYRQLAQFQADENEKMLRRLGVGSAGAFNAPRASTPGATTSNTGAYDDAKDLVSKAASGAKGFAAVTESTVDNWRRASDVGISFNNDAIGLRSSVGQTRLSVDEWEGAVRRGSVGFTALNGTMSDSTRVFNKMSKDFSDTTAADQLRVAGWTTKEYNEVLAVSITGRRNLDMNDKASRQSAIESTAALAQEMDLVSKLTGKSRQEQLKAAQEKQSDARLQAAIELEILNGDKDAREKYNMMNAQLQKSGLDKLGDVLYTGRGMSPEQQAQMAALGTAGTALKSAIQATKTARSPEEKAAAKAQLDAAQAEVAARVQSKEYLQATTAAGGKLGDAMGDIFLKTRAYKDAIMSVQEEQKKLGKTVNEAEAQKILEERAERERKGLDRQGDAIAGANSTALVVQAQNRLKDSTVGLYQTLDAINQRFGKTQIVSDALTKAQNVKAGPKGEAEGFASRFSRTYGIDKLNEGIEKGESLKSIAPFLKTAVVEGFKDGLGVVKDINASTINVGSIKEGAQNLWEGVKSAINSGVKPKEFFDGTMGPGGDFSKLFQDFGKGTPAILHGKEAVINEKQFQGMFNGIQTNMKTELDKAKTGMPDVSSFQKMFSQIKMPDPAEITSQITSKMPAMPAGAGNNDAITDVAKGVNQLNMRMERLIAAVEEGTGKNVRALKAGGNILQP